MIDSSDGSGAKQLASILAAEGAAVVMDFVGNDQTIEMGVGCLRKGGSFALIGSGGGSLKREWYNALPKDGEIFTYEGATIMDTREVIALAEAGKIRNDVDVHSFDEVEQAYAKLVSGELKGRAVVKLAE